jgi:Holliday junction resolvase-like predicted endonuclease
MAKRVEERARKARRFGRLCEWATAWVMWALGWDLVGRNLRVGALELDVLMVRGSDLRLLEVKARRRGAWVGADTALGPRQRLRLQVALRAWLRQVPWPGQVTFQRVSWRGVRCRLHPPERWESLSLPAGQTGLELRVRVFPVLP